MTDLIESFFGSGEFIPHGHCYLWKPGLVWLHVTSDSLIALSYYSIPLTLFYFVRWRKDLPFNWIFLLFAGFITACGTTHILQVWTLWHPIYWLSGAMKGVTAIVSLGTAIALVPLIPPALMLPSPTQLRLANQELEHEICDRKHVETALRQSEQKFKGAFESLSVGMGFVSVLGGFLEVNAQLCRMLGYTEAELLTRRLEDIVHPDDRQGDLELIERLFAGEILNYQVEQRFLQSNGHSIWGLLSMGLMRNEAQLPLYLIAQITDISDRKRAEKELELQAVIVRSMADGVCLVRSADGIIVYANPKFNQVFGYSTGELHGQHVSVVNYEDPNEAIANRIMNSIREFGEATYEVLNVKKDGTPFWCQATASVFNHPDFGTTLVAVQHDITLAKQAETIRQQAERQLQASLKEKEVLLKEIHHRVKNNLQIVYSLLRLQRRTLKDSQAAEILLDSQNRIESIALIHEKLYSAENLATIKSSEYIPGLLANVLSSYHNRSKQIAMETEIDDISLDIDQAVPCGLIINELISNSLKYAFPHQDTGLIQVTFRADEANVMLIVRDDGIGLPKEFDLAQTNSLGLQLVQDFVAQLQGVIEINCSAGAEFRIQFCRGRKT